MELKDILMNNELSNFTKKCLFDSTSIYDHKDTKKILNEYVEKAKDLNDFCSSVLSDKRLWYNQGYWELAKERFSNIKIYDDFTNEFLDDIADDSFVTDSDIGSLKVGNNGFSVALNNGYGDGKNVVYIIEKEVNIECLKFMTVVEGNDICIYDYDCGNDIAKNLSGRYAVYGYDRRSGKDGEIKTFGSGIFVFVKWE